MTAPTEPELLALVQSGARDRYAELVGRHQDPLYRFALGMLSDPREARECVEEAFFVGYTRLGDRPGPGRFRGWVFGILRQECRSRLRAGSTDRADRPLRGDPSASGPGVAGPPSTLQEAVRVLPDPDLREVFLLKHVEGLPFEEVAELLGTGVDEVRAQVRRAREILFIGLG